MNDPYDDEFYEEDFPERREEVFRKNKKSCSSGCFGLIGLMVSLFWLLNLGCGIIEIPDCLPIIGHLDEVFFTIILLGSLSALGIEIPLLSKLVSRNSNMY